MSELGDELTVDGVTWVLIDSAPIRLMTGNKSLSICAMCQARGVVCKSPYANNKAYCMCGDIASAVFVKKLEV